MRRARVAAWAAAWLAVLPGAGWPEGSFAPTVCRQDHVEYLIGGVAATTTHCAAPVPSAPRGQREGASERDARFVSPEAQRHRDVDRRSILAGELEREQAHLSTLPAAAAAANPSLAAERARTLDDIAALQRELQHLN